MKIDHVLSPYLRRRIVTEKSDEVVHPFHQHLLAMALIRKPPDHEQVVKDWLAHLVKAVDMEVWYGPITRNCTDKGNEGISGIVLLKTSHASIHFWPDKEVPYCQFDLYSCKAYDPKIPLNLLKAFDPINIRYRVINRNAGIPQL